MTMRKIGNAPIASHGDVLASDFTAIFAVHLVLLAGILWLMPRLLLLERLCSCWPS